MVGIRSTVMNHTNHISRPQDGDRLSRKPLLDFHTAISEFLGNDLEAAILGVKTLLGSALSLEFPENLDIRAAIQEYTETGCKFGCKVLVEQDVGAEIDKNSWALGEPGCEFRVGFCNRQGGEENWTCASDVGWDEEGKVDGGGGHADDRGISVATEQGGNLAFDAAGVTIICDLLEKRVCSTGVKSTESAVDVGEYVVPAHGVGEPGTDLGKLPEGAALGLIADDMIFESIGAQEAEFLAKLVACVCSLAQERVDGTEGWLDFVDDFNNAAVTDHVLNSIPGAECCGNNIVVRKDSTLNSGWVHLDEFVLSCSGLLHRFSRNRVEGNLAGCGEAGDL